MTGVLLQILVLVLVVESMTLNWRLLVPIKILEDWACEEDTLGLGLKIMRGTIDGTEVNIPVPCFRSFNPKIEVFNVEGFGDLTLGNVLKEFQMMYPNAKEILLASAKKDLRAET